MSVSEWDFRRALVEQPVDRELRLIFADWLEEKGRALEASQMRQHHLAPGHPVWRLGYRYSGDGGDGGCGGGGDGGYGGDGGDGGYGGYGGGGDGGYGGYGGYGGGGG